MLFLIKGIILTYEMSRNTGKGDHGSHLSQVSFYGDVTMDRKHQTNDLHIYLRDETKLIHWRLISDSLI